jgi:penicillin-binding protein 1A
MTIQKEAERAFHDHLVKIKETLGSDLDGGLTTIESVSGEIKALVGGYNFQDSKFNRALQAKRQMGSIFKPLVYAAAVEKGASLQDTALDEPLEIDSATGTWRPRNNTRKFAGIMTFARALSYSNNIVTIKAFFKAGAKHVIDFARRCYLSGSMSPYPSLSLGCVDGTTCEAVGMFNVFANHGIYVQPHYLRWVKDGLGTKIYKHDPIQKKACSSKVADQIMKVLTLGMVRLQRAIGKTWFGGDAMGKTGTTNDSRTCWFCGATPEFTTALYIGTDDNRSMGKRVYGVRTAFPIWFAMHKALDRGDKKFYYDPSLKEVMIDWKTGQLSSDQNNSEVVSILVE